MSSAIPRPCVRAESQCVLAAWNAWWMLDDAVDGSSQRSVEMACTAAAKREVFERREESGFYRLGPEVKTVR
jgi:hypothetical protein